MIDVNKKMVIQYDWRDMPVTFRFYNSIPAGESSSQKIYPDSNGTYTINDGLYSGRNSLEEYCKWAEGEGTVQRLSTVYMVYDAAGSRVLKLDGEDQ